MEKLPVALDAGLGIGTATATQLVLAEQSIPGTSIPANYGVGAVSMIAAFAAKNAKKRQRRTLVAACTLSAQIAVDLAKSRGTLFSGLSGAASANASPEVTG